ncbi:MAG: hypothetical protein ABR574_11450 [Cryomorphaceae bacterium]
MRLLIVVIFVLCLGTVHAQQFYVEVGRVGTGFDYEDSNSEGIDNIFPEQHFSYSIGYRHSISERFYPTIGLVYATYGAYGSDNFYSNSYSWRMGYAGLSLGMEGEVYKTGNLRFLAKVGIEPQILTSGTQTINGEVFNLRGVEQFENPFMFFKAGAGANYCLNSTIALGLKYYYGKGFPLGSSSDPEILRLNTHTVALGITVSLGRCDYCFKSHFNKK